MTDKWPTFDLGNSIRCSTPDYLPQFYPWLSLTLKNLKNDTSISKLNIQKLSNLSQYLSILHLSSKFLLMMSPHVVNPNHGPCLIVTFIWICSTDQKRNGSKSCRSIFNSKLFFSCTIWRGFKSFLVPATGCSFCNTNQTSIRVGVVSLMDT